MPAWSRPRTTTGDRPMFRQTILVAASLLGMVCLVLGEEAPRRRRPQQQTTQRRKSYSRKTYQQKPSPVALAPQVKIDPCTPSKTATPPAAQPKSEADKDKKSEEPRPQTVPANSSGPMNGNHGPSDLKNGTDEAPAVTMPKKQVDEAERQLYLTPG